MRLHSLKYLLVYITPAVVIFSIASNHLLTFSAIILLFGVIPILELFTVGSTKNLSEEEEMETKQSKFYDFILYSLVPLQYLILILFLFRIQDTNLSIVEIIGVTTAYGLACGILGINAAHELGHRPTKHEQLMSKMLLLTSLYMHFFIEHNRGHHRYVSTDEDPASSRYGESVYAFFIRSVIGSWLSAWKLEGVRLEKKKLPFWSFENEMLRFQLIQLALVMGIFLLFDLKTMLLFIAGAILGFLLLETVNYIEHYGLRRRKKGKTYERTMPIHSWNSNHPLGRMMLLELSRHSDHHYMASRKYQVLRHFDESPQMPTGYPGMMILSLVPPLWFKVMHKRIEAYKKGVNGEQLD
jgi:alkane 1-monooxygenase